MGAAMQYNFEWDEFKAQLNIKKHGISFDEAKTVFNDENSITIDDPYHSSEEERYINIGRSENGNILIVIYTERGDNLRIISARKATTAEKKEYEQF